MISILYVDDETGLLRLCKLYLEGTRDFTVDTAESAQAALEKLHTTSYDAIVSDYKMPGMNGIEFLKTLRSSGDTTPFLIFTGKGREEVVIEAFNNGADSYIQKGGEPKAQFAELIHTIRNSVMHHHQKSALEESEKKYRDFFRTSRDAVFITSLDGKIVDVNTQFVEMSGYDSREDLLSVNVAGLYSNPDDRRTHIRTIMEKGYTKEYPIELRKKDGTFLSTLVTTVPRKDIIGTIIGFQGTIRDITAQKQAEDALRVSEERFRNIYCKSPIAIELYNNEGVLTDVNQACCILFGIESADAIKGFQIFNDPNIPPDQLKLLKKGETIRYEYDFDFGPVKEQNLYTTSRSGTLSLDVLITPLKTEQCTPAGYLAYVIDITQRKRAEESLKYSYGRFKTAMDSLDALVYVVDIHTYEILFLNRYGRDIWGDIEGGVCWLTAHSGQTGPCPFCSNDRIVDEHGNPTGVYRWEFNNTFNGKWYDCRDSAIRWIDGRLVKIEIATDITDKKLAEQALLESNERYRTLAEASPDMIYIVNRDDIVQYVNSTALKLLQSPLDEVIGRPRSNLFPSAITDRQEILLKEVLETGESQQKEGLIRIGNAELWIDSKLVPLKDETGTVTAVLGVSRDISKRRHAEEALQQANRQLNLLTSITRHDILNQVSILLGYLELAEEEFTDPAFVHVLGELKSASDTIQSQIKFTMVYQDLGTQEPQWQDLESVISRISQDQKKVKIITDMKGIEVYADPMFRKVFSNLFDNSVRHGQHVTEIRVFSRQSEKGLTVVWEDNGVGIVADEKERIFERGFGKNTGFGLFLVREILSLTGMSIKETGTPGMNARFEITVPKGKFRISVAGKI